MRIKYAFGILVCICVLAMCATVITVTSVGRRENNAPDGGAAATTVVTTTVTAQTADGLPVLEILSAKEDGEWVTVDSTFGSFRYPTAFSDVLRVEAVEQGESASLRFVARIAAKDVTVYTLHYGKATGIRCGTLRLSNTAEEIAVYADLAEKPAGVPDDWASTFYAAQETFNDVLSSMTEDSRFTRWEGA